jgi:hypothetical protein
VSSRDPSAEKTPHNAGFYAAAVYGSIVGAALISVLREEHSSSQRIALALVSTLAVFWAVHVWSEIIGERIELGIQFSYRHAGEIARKEWPLIEAAFAPTSVLLLGWAGALGDRAAATAALSVCLIQLFAWGLVLGRRAYKRWSTAVLSGIGNGLLGLALVALEIRIVH